MTFKDQKGLNQTTYKPTVSALCVCVCCAQTVFAFICMCTLGCALGTRIKRSDPYFKTHTPLCGLALLLNNFSFVSRSTNNYQMHQISNITRTVFDITLNCMYFKIITMIVCTVKCLYSYFMVHIYNSEDTWYVMLHSSNNKQAKIVFYLSQNIST